jgi:hypothetical protein
MPKTLTCLILASTCGSDVLLAPTHVRLSITIFRLELGHWACSGTACLDSLDSLCVSVLGWERGRLISLLEA